MSVSGGWIKTMDEQGDVLTGCYVDYIRWVCPSTPGVGPSAPGHKLVITFLDENGDTNTIYAVANGSNFSDIIWVNLKGDLTLTTMEAGLVNVFLRR